MVKPKSKSSNNIAKIYRKEKARNASVAPDKNLLAVKKIKKVTKTKKDCEDFKKKEQVCANSEKSEEVNNNSKNPIIKEEVDDVKEIGLRIKCFLRDKSDESSLLDYLEKIKALKDRNLIFEKLLLDTSPRKYKNIHMTILEYIVEKGYNHIVGYYLHKHLSEAEIPFAKISKSDLSELISIAWKKRDENITKLLVKKYNNLSNSYNYCNNKVIAQLIKQSYLEEKVHFFKDLACFDNLKAVLRELEYVPDAIINQKLEFILDYAGITN